MTVDECVAKARKVVAAHTKAKLIEYAGLLVESGLPLDEVAAEVERSAATCAAALETPAERISGVAHARRRENLH